MSRMTVDDMKLARDGHLSAFAPRWLREMPPMRWRIERDDEGKPARMFWTGYAGGSFETIRDGWAACGLDVLNRDHKAGPPKLECGCRRGYVQCDAARTLWLTSKRAEYDGEPDRAAAIWADYEAHHGGGIRARKL